MRVSHDWFWFWFYFLLVEKAARDFLAKHKIDYSFVKLEQNIVSGAQFSVFQDTPCFYKIMFGNFLNFKFARSWE